MNTLFVLAHPESRSFNGALRDAALAALTGAGHRVRESDLYAQGFNPVAGPTDFTTRSDPLTPLDYPTEQRAAWQAGRLVPDIRAEQDKLDWADLVVLQFPLWWYSMPAILKGWCERVFALGYAYGAGRMFDRGGLAGKRAMISCTTAGRETSYGATGWHGAIEDVLFPVHNGLHFVGFNILPPMISYAVNRCSDETRQGYLAEFRARLLAAADTPPLYFPPLDTFGEDGALRPEQSARPRARWL